MTKISKFIENKSNWNGPIVIGSCYRQCKNYKQIQEHKEGRNTCTSIKPPASCTNQSDLCPTQDDIPFFQILSLQNMISEWKAGEIAKIIYNVVN